MGSFTITFHILDSQLKSYSLKRLKKLLISYIDEINFRKGEMDPDDVVEMEELLRKFTAPEASSDQMEFSRLQLNPVESGGKVVHQLRIDLKNVVGVSPAVPFAIITATD